MIWVWTVSLPVTILNSPNVLKYDGQDQQPDFGTGRDIAGIILFVLGFILESVGDIQKYRFRSDTANKGKFCDVGFFKWSRHPNYFGEIIMQFCKPAPSNFSFFLFLLFFFFFSSFFLLFFFFSSSKYHTYLTPPPNPPPHFVRLRLHYNITLHSFFKTPPKFQEGVFLTVETRFFFLKKKTEKKKKQQSI